MSSFIFSDSSSVFGSMFIYICCNHSDKINSPWRAASHLQCSRWTSTSNLGFFIILMSQGCPVSATDCTNWQTLALCHHKNGLTCTFSLSFMQILGSCWWHLTNWCYTEIIIRRRVGGNRGTFNLIRVPTDQLSHKVFTICRCELQPSAGKSKNGDIMH